MIKKIIAFALLASLSTPAFGANPGYTGHVFGGGRGGNVAGEMAIFAADFSGGSDPLGDFDLRLDTMIQLSAKTKHLTMRANISPSVTGRFKKILQRYTIVAQDVGTSVVLIHTKDQSSGVPVRYSSAANVWAYRISVDGGRTWSDIKQTVEQ